MNTGLISLTEAAAYLGCTPRAIRKVLDRRGCASRGIPVRGQRSVLPGTSPGVDHFRRTSGSTPTSGRDPRPEAASL